MPDRSFYGMPSPVRLGDVLPQFCGEHAHAPIHNVGEISELAPGIVVYCTDARYFQAAVAFLRAHPKHDVAQGVLITSHALLAAEIDAVAYAKQRGVILLGVEDARHAFLMTALALYPHPQTDSPEFAVPASNLPSSARIAPTAIIEEGVTLGENCVVDHHSIIRRGCTIGDNVSIGPNCFIEFAQIGNDVYIDADVTLGRRGYGFMHNHAIPNDQPGHIIHVPHLGRVIIGNNCYLGRLVQIARGTLSDTIIGHAVMIGNGSEITHNCRVGDNCLLVGHNGLAGSVTLGKDCFLSGKVAIAPHVTVADGARFIGHSGVYQDIEEGGDYMGSPAMPKRIAMRDHFLRMKAARGKPTSR